MLQRSAVAVLSITFSLLFTVELETRIHKIQTPTVKQEAHSWCGRGVLCVLYFY